MTPRCCPTTGISRPLARRSGHGRTSGAFSGGYRLYVAVSRGVRPQRADVERVSELVDTTAVDQLQRSVKRRRRPVQLAAKPRSGCRRDHRSAHR